MKFKERKNGKIVKENIKEVKRGEKKMKQKVVNKKVGYSNGVSEEIEGFKFYQEKPDGSDGGSITFYPDEIIIKADLVDTSMSDRQIELLDELKRVYSLQNSHLSDVLHDLANLDSDVFERRAISIYELLDEEEYVKVVNEFSKWVLNKKSKEVD